MSLAQRILKEHKGKIGQLTLIPSSGGVFEVVYEGKLIFSKKKENRKPNHGEVEAIVRETLGVESTLIF